MNLTLDGGTAQQRQWFTDAVDKAVYDWENLTANVTVTWPVEPSLEGHQESACTTTIGSESAIEMRRNLDDPEAWPEGKPFYQETVIHELAHVMCFTFLDVTQREEICPWFFKDRIGTGKILGTADDLNPLDKPWEERIVEAMAEILKDTFMPERYRASDNRTYWKILPERFQDFIGYFVESASEGGCNEMLRIMNDGWWTDPDWLTSVPAESGVVHTFDSGFQSQFPVGFGGRIRVRNAAGFTEWGEIPPPRFPYIYEIAHNAGTNTWVLRNYPPDFSETWAWDGSAWVNAGGSPAPTVVSGDFLDGSSVVTTVFCAPTVVPPEFPYKDSTVGSGGNDVGVIRLGPSLLT